MKRLYLLAGILMWFLLPGCAGTFMSGQRYMVVDITSDPEGVDVTDLESGTYWGKTPTSRIIWSGSAMYKANRVEYDLIFEKAGFKSVTRKLNLKPRYVTKKSARKNAKKVHVILEKIADKEAKRFMTEIRISSDPTGASVYANEEYIGNTPITETFTWYSASDRIELRFEKSDYATERRMVTPEDKRIHVVLHRK